MFKGNTHETDDDTLYVIYCSYFRPKFSQSLQDLQMMGFIGTARAEDSAKKLVTLHS